MPLGVRYVLCDSNIDKRAQELWRWEEAAPATEDSLLLPARTGTHTQKDSAAPLLPRGLHGMLIFHTLIPPVTLFDVWAHFLR